MNFLSLHAGQREGGGGQEPALVMCDYGNEQESWGNKVQIESPDFKGKADI